MTFDPDSSAAPNLANPPLDPAPLDPHSLDPLPLDPASVGPYVPPSLASLGYEMSPPQPGRPRVWTAFAAFGITLATVLGVGVIQAIAMMIYNGGFPNADDIYEAFGKFLSTMPGLLLLGLPGFLGAAGAVTAAILSPIPWKQRLELDRIPRPLLLIIPAILGVFALGESMGCALNLLEVEAGGSLLALSHMFDNLSGLRLVLAVFVVGFCAGIGEEFVFRGYIQSRLRKRWGSIFAIACTSILFGIMHMDLIHSPTAALIGVYLGYIAVRTSNVWFCVVVHVVNNSMAVLQSHFTLETPSSLNWLFGYLLLLLLCVAAIHFLTRAKSPAI